VQFARLIITSITLLTLPGCASTISAWKNRSFKEQGFHKPALYSMTGERRLAIAVKPTTYDMRFCAESLPEAAAAYSATSGASLKPTGVGEGSISDASSMVLTQTYTRTEISEVLRQLGFQTCQAWAQGVLDENEYKLELKNIVAAGIEVMKNRSLQPLTPPAAAQKTADK